MAVLPQEDRDRVYRAVMREWSRLRESCSFTKSELTAAVAATDDWIDSNAASFNNALPIPFRTGATLAQKTLLFMFVLIKRNGRNNPDED